MQVFFSERFCRVKPNGEVREIALGTIENITIAVVIFVDRSRNDEEIIRIVSARPATNSEKAQYYSADI
ncbi:hypothetical protein C4X99_04930 [Leptospira interrogans serovar Geyaweera]|nr:hypothetical protein C4X99_04930 [Leptospira interrogans serovar Geyaweera]MBM2890565.1 BrnT family toxin [Leptospira interrogans]